MRSKTVVQILISLVLIGLAVLLANYFLSKPPKAKRINNKGREATLVEVINIHKANYKVNIDAMGSVEPARQVDVRSRVSGEVIEVNGNLIPGGIVRGGDVLVHIDDADYQLLLKQKQAAVVQAQTALAIEQGRQSVAERELAMIQQYTDAKSIGSPLALRQPQQLQAQAELAKAIAQLDETKLALSRTTINAPFTGLITEKLTAVGAYVTAQQALATLVDTREYWIRATIPVDKLGYLHQGVKGSSVKIVGLNSDTSVEGKVIRIIGKLDDNSLLAPILISVADPLQLKKNSKPKHQLILGDTVSLLIKGRTLKDIFRIERYLLHDNNTVWLFRDNKLLIQHIKVLHQDRDYVYFKNDIVPSDKLISSDIATPVAGMSLKLLGDKPSITAKKQQALQGSGHE